MFGAIFSFAIIKPLSRILPLWAGGGYFGAKENVTAQSAATTGTLKQQGMAYACIYLYDYSF